MLLCASDNFSFETRIQDSFEAISNGADWFQVKSGHFYNILENESGLFDKKDGYQPALFMAISNDGLKRVVRTDFPKSGVDSWLFKQVNPTNLVELDFTNGIHTDGFNTISHRRRLMYKDGVGLFTKSDQSEVFEMFPKEIQSKLLKMRL